MGNSVGIDAWTLATLELELKDDLPCEMEDHGVDSYWHDSGPGKWYMSYMCGMCGDKGVQLVCVRAHRTIWVHGYEECIECSECGECTTPSEFFIREEMRNV